jgi:hypothetical protein
MPSSTPEAPGSVRITQGHPTYAEPDRDKGGQTDAPKPDGRQPQAAHGPPAAPLAEADAEVLDDGQEEVFSPSAVERGLTKDPKALGPEDLAAHQCR